MERIKDYWNSLAQEYEKEHKSAFLEDYDKSVPYFKKMENFLLEQHKEKPQDVDIICSLASVEMELRKGEEHSIMLLENFLKENEDTLSLIDRARLYTNIGFYYDYSEEMEGFLLKASECKSPFPETYKGLGLYYFTKYQSNNCKNDLEQSHIWFKKAMELFDDYEFCFDYAVSLYEGKAYEEAKEIFERLLENNPNRMRLMLSLAYCEAFLGNKMKARSYLKEVKIGQDLNYSLYSDEINDYEFIDVFYVLDEYDCFLEWYREIIESFYYADWEHYFYSLWKVGKKEVFDQSVKKYILLFEEAIAEAEQEDFDSVEEMEEYLELQKKEFSDFKNMIQKIKHGIEKPQIKLSLYPEYSCCFVDCVRHKF